jgi:hypothetical protein
MQAKSPPPIQSSSVSGSGQRRSSATPRTRFLGSGRKPPAVKSRLGDLTSSGDPAKRPDPTKKTILPGCRKLYVPLGEEGASAAPFGFVLQAVRTEEGLAWGFLAFGERHPDNPATRSVYQRAHKRLHGRYP